MRLLIWTSGKADIIQEALAPPFSRIENVPEHEVVPYEQGVLLKAEKGDVVLGMGGKVLAEMQAHGYLPKNRSIDSLRLSQFTGPDGGAYFLTLDPFLVRTRADAPSLIAQDVALACRFANTGSVDPKLGQYRYVDDFDDLVNEIYQRLLAGEEVELACDTETIGLFPEAEGARLVTIQFTLDDGTADVYYVPDDGMPDDYVLAQIVWLFTTQGIKMEGANFKFDLRWIRRHWGVVSTNFTCDTLIVGSMLDENRSNSLKSHAWIYTALGGYDRLGDMGYDKGHMDLVPKEVLLPYAGADTDVTRQSARKLKEELTQAGMLRRLYLRIVHPASRVFEDMEHEGVVVDVQQLHSLSEELSHEMASLEQQMFAMMGARLKAKYADNLSITRAVVLRDYFFSRYGLNLTPKMTTAKAGDPSTAKAHLMMFHDHPEAGPFVELLSAYNSASKTKSTFVEGFLKHVRADGRLHPSYMLFAGSLYGNDNDDSGTVTGRTSCKDPAFQTLPKKTAWAKKLRACYPAPEGHLILQLDFAQGELKVVACVAHEENMLAAFSKGLDLHTVTASEFMGLTYEQFVALEETDPALHTLMRTGAKAGNFGLLYGMQANPGFREYARIQFGFHMTPQEAEERREKFLYEMYPGLPRYHIDAEEFAKENGFIESPLGRRRNLPLISSPDSKSRSDAVRQAINAPIQSTLNDLTFRAAVEIKRAVPAIRPFGMIHDAMYYYVPMEGHGDPYDLGRKARDVMSNLPIKKEFGWDHQLQFTADAEMGLVLNQMAKI